MPFNKNDQAHVDFFEAWLDNPLVDREWRKFVVRKGVVYYKHLALLPFARVDADGDVLMEFHLKTKLPLYFFFNVRENMRPRRVLLVQYLFPEKENLLEYDLRYSDLWSLITTYMDWYVHHNMNQWNYPMQDAVLDYIIKYDCAEVFYDVNTNEIGDYRTSTYHANWFERYYRVHPEVNEATLNLVKQVKMGLLLKNLGM